MGELLDQEALGSMPEVLWTPEQDKAQTECGFFGIYSPVEAAIGDSIYLGIKRLQHRGQLSAGIALNTPSGVETFLGEGLVVDALEHHLSSMPWATIGLGHTRYATTKNTMTEERRLKAVMPIMKEREGRRIAVSGNYNFKFARDVANELGYDYDTFGSDGDFVSELIADRAVELGDVEKAAIEVLNRFKNDAFCIGIMTDEELMVFQDPRGVRPLIRGRLQNGGWVVASELGALQAVNATDTEEFKPGHMMIIGRDGVRTERVFEEQQRSLCVFEHVYFAKENIMLGNTVEQARFDAGRALARVAPVDVDFVAAVPGTAVASTKGYAYESGLPIVKIFDVAENAPRSFIEPKQSKRELVVATKLKPKIENVRGRRFVLDEDSIVRGTTARYIIASLRAAGAVEIHARIASPPPISPCFDGVDMKTIDELFANQYKTTEARRKALDVDSLAYLPLEDLLRTAGKNVGELLCHACFSGEYPTEVPVNLIPRN